MSFLRPAAIVTPQILNICPLQSATFTCMTDTAALLWIPPQGYPGQQQYFSNSSSAIVNDTRSLGVFTVQLVSVVGSNFISTATLSTNVSSSLNITCDDNGDAKDGYIAMLRVQGKMHNICSPHFRSII